MDYSTVNLILILACDYKTSQGGTWRYGKVDNRLWECPKERKEEGRYW